MSDKQFKDFISKEEASQLPLTIQKMKKMDQAESGNTDFSSFVKSSFYKTERMECKPFHKSVSTIYLAHE